MKKDILTFLRSLPEGSELDFMNEEYTPLEVCGHMEGEKINGSKEITLLLTEVDSGPKDYTYNLKHLDGIQTLSRFWDRYKEDLFSFCCNSNDSRWRDDGFRDHMYNQYFKTDRPITDQLFNLDQDNLRTLMRYIDEELTRGINSSREVTF